MESETNRNCVTNNPSVTSDGFAGPSVRQDDGRGSNPTPRTKPPEEITPLKKFQRSKFARGLVLRITPVLYRSASSTLLTAMD